MKRVIFSWNKHLIYPELIKGVLQYAPTIAVLFLFLFTLPHQLNQVQAVDDTCVAAASGDWTAAATWTSCNDGTTGYPDSDDTTTIDAYTITIADGFNAQAGDISMTTTTSQITVGGGTSGSLTATSITFGAVANSAGLTVNTGASVSISGAVSLDSANANTSATIAGSGQITTGSVSVGSAVSPSDTRTTILTSTISTFTVNGTISTTCSDGSSASHRNDPYINLNSGSMSVSSTITLCNSSSENYNGRAFFQMNQASQNATLTLSQATSTIWIMGAGGLAAANLNGSGNTVIYSGAAAQVRVTDYRNLTLSGTDPNIGALATVNGNLNLSAGSTSSVTTGANITVGGTLQINSNNTFIIGGTNTFTITDAATIDGTLTISTIGATETFSGAVTVNGTLNLSNNSITKTFNGNLTINNGSTWNNSVNANVTIAGSLYVNGGTITWSTGTYTMSGAGQSINAANGVNITIPNLSVSANSVTNNLTTTLNNTLTVTTALGGTGTLAQATNAQLVISGTSTISNLTATTTPNIVIYNGSGTQTLKATTYYDLEYAGSGTGTLGGTTNADHDFTITSGNVSGSTFTLNIKRNFTNNGTFTPGSSTVTFIDAAQTSTILNPSGGTTFNNLSVTTANKNVHFDHTDKTIVTGTLTLTGTDCNNMVILDTDSPSTQFTINATGTNNITYTFAYNSIAETQINATYTYYSNSTGWQINSPYCGTFSLDVPSGATLGQIALDSPPPSSTGNFDDVLMVTDSRGIGVGWTVFATTSHFGSVGNPVRVSGTGDTITLSSGAYYDYPTGGVYTVTITKKQDQTCEYSITSLLESTPTAQPIGTGVAVGTRGVAIDFGSCGNYSLNDSWTITVRSISIDGNEYFSIDPDNDTLTALSGSLTGITAEQPDAFTSTSYPCNIVTASSGNGNGQYTINPDLSLIIPPGTYPGNYSATITLTLN